MQYQKEEIRKKILKAATATFGKYGYANARMMQISKQSHQPIGNMYRYFPSKEILFDAVVTPAREQCDSLVDGLRAEVNAKLQSKPYDTYSVPLVEIGGRVAEVLEELFGKFSIQIKILLEKSLGSKHESYEQELINKIVKQLRDIFKGFDVINDHLVPTIIARGLIEGFMYIFANYPKEKRKEQIENLIVFNFHKLEERMASE
ncbi:MAG TPA: TetR/AcrR family transcriptional regulator [Clostridia bacterium]|jgi:AcrR family transcriptional regulator|nr:TetR/AcrR family transcriptional regulator [Clostridia bacterium]